MTTSPLDWLVSRLNVLRRFTQLAPLQKRTLLRRRFPRWSGLNRGNFHRLETLAEMAESRPRGHGVVFSCIPHPTTGFGHRLSEWITGYTVARAAGVPFLNGGLGEEWDIGLGIRGAFPETANYLAEFRPVCVHLPMVAADKGSVALEELASMVSRVRTRMSSGVVMFADGQSLYSQHLYSAELRELVWRRSSHLSRRRTREGSVRVCVHVRRGDVQRMKAQGSGDWQRRFVHVEWFEQAVAAVQRGLGALPMELHIFSQGRLQEANAWGAMPNVNWHLDGDPVQSFLQMAAADILITSPSSFSFNAGLLGWGLKVARYPWWHDIPDNREWVRVGDSPEAWDEVSRRVEDHCRQEAASRR